MICKLHGIQSYEHPEAPAALEGCCISSYPNECTPCYDCGSTIPRHHTPNCDLMCPDHEIGDLPAQPGTQYWTREVR